MNIALWHVRSLLFGSPLAIHPSKFDAIVGAVSERIGIEATAEQLEAAANSKKSQSAGYSVQNGIAIIPISGSLMKKTSGLMAASGSASYETIGAQFEDAMKNANIKGVLLALDSPGGTTSGLFELAQKMSELKSKMEKPIFAISDDSCYSAAYALASVADKLYLTQTGGVGSIGVFCAHVDQSQADQKSGLAYSFIHAGDKKIDGNSHAPLSESARADTQAEVDRQYQMFVSLVARNRGISEDDVRNTQAGVFFGEAAVPLLADCVGTLEDCLSDLMDVSTGKANINTSARTPNLNTKQMKGELEETGIMAKANTEINIDDLVAKHAAEALEAAQATKSDKECDEEMKKADAEDGDEDEDDKKKKKDDEDDEDEDEAKKGKKAVADLTRIVNLCAISGMPALATEFLSAGYTVAQVEKALLKHRATKSKEVKIGTTKPTNDFASVAKNIAGDKSITDKAQAYREYLLANTDAYIDSMINRKNGDSYGKVIMNYKRGY